MPLQFDHWCFSSAAIIVYQELHIVVDHKLAQDGGYKQLRLDANLNRSAFQHTWPGRPGYEGEQGYRGGSTTWQQFTVKEQLEQV
jgi:hypothetical protein